MVHLRPLLVLLVAGFCSHVIVDAQELGSTMILKKTQFIAEQLAKMTEAEKGAFRCKGQDSQVPVLNTFPVMYGDDEPSLCKNFPFVDHALVEKDPIFSRSYRNRGRHYRAGEMIVMLVHIMNTALPTTSTRDTIARRVTIENSVGPNKANEFAPKVDGENLKFAKTATINVGAPKECSAVLLPNSGAIYDYRGFRIGPSRRKFGKGKLLLGDIKPGWEHSRFVTVLFQVLC